MGKTMNVATCFSSMFQAERGVQIDEMKLYKLIYFAQRESFIQTGDSEHELI